MDDRDGRRSGAGSLVPADRDVAAESESIGAPQGRGAATGGVIRRRAVRSPLVSETMQQESVPQALVGRPLLQEVLTAMRQLPDRSMYEQLLRRIDAVEGIAQRAVGRPDAASRLAPMLADLRNAVHVEIVTAVEQMSERMARSAAEHLATRPEPTDAESVAGAVDRRMQGAREQAERRIDARFAAVEKQLADLCERFGAAESMEAIAAMNSRLDRIERVLSTRDPLLANLGAELRALHTRLEESDARLREAVADSIDRAAGQAADRAVHRGDRGARLSVSAAAVEADRSADDAARAVPGAIQSYLESAGPASGRSRWSSAALLAFTAAVIAVPMVIAWQDIDSHMVQQRRDAEVIRLNIQPTEPQPAPASSSAGDAAGDLAQVNDR